MLFLILIYADLLFVSALALELDNAVLESEERIVSADADIVPGMDLRSALTDNDAAREHCLPVLTLDAEALCLTVTAVVGGTRSLLCANKLIKNIFVISLIENFRACGPCVKERSSRS